MPSPHALESHADSSTDPSRLAAYVLINGLNVIDDDIDYELTTGQCY
jgi:hypothetical protein